MTSGAIYNGVPQRVKVFPCSCLAVNNDSKETTWRNESVDVVWRRKKTKTTKEAAHNKTLTESKVYNDRIPLKINQYIFWFQVAINNLTFVHVCQTFKDACGVELGVWFT